ncbi:MAG TPA: DNA polymerase, partial [Pyrinomonadaceae bacterium]|nr:DNA polymerase [Pyrinomonadaceae bacterium]
MEVYFQLITDPDSLKNAVGDLRRSEFIGFDTETTELDPYRGELRLVQLSDGKKTQVIDLRHFGSNGGLRGNEGLAPLFDLLSDEKIIKVAHNAKFDAKWVRHHLGCELNGVFDTFLASQLIAAGDQDRRHSLADVTQFFTGIELDKSMQVSDWGANELSQLQVEYAARDAAVMTQLRDQLAERLKSDDLERVAALEFDCLMPISEMELNGVHLDQSRWREQLERVKIAQVKAADELQDLLSAGVAQASLFGRAEINLDSQVQVTDALVNLGVPVPQTTRGWQLQPLAVEYPVVAKLLEYRGVAKSLTSFGENILEFIEPSTGRIHADFRQIGAPTGRFSCSSPNLQQIPHEKEYRRCFTAEPGNKLVIADYSQIELRILAEFSGDERFIDAFVSGQDFHAATASQVFGVSAAEVTDEQRSFAKRLNFGIVYGIGASRFGLMTGLSQTQAEDTMRKYFGTFRKLDDYLRNAGRRLIEERNARTASGRLLRLRFDESDRQQVSSARRYGINMPIQGTSADILKRSLRLLHDQIRGTSARLVNIVHDEVIVECSAADAAATAAILENAMCTAGEEFVKKVPVKVD